ncbi:hypothetical protein T472_0204215 [Youngiibacter fragilis 232.1]|uniref:DUF362 domain-containing protein n=2 Tax=Youngiibacter TaxID=1408818 RepID=V7I992_9CLOT|nr:hypothetical protein T472_0204215 [Youngiibacter fragilis 232.1]
MASKVYFMNDRANSLQESTPFKAVKLLRDAGLKTLFKEGDTVGIKIHMGEYGNSLNLRPQWVGAIVEEVKRLGGNPVIVDCNTITFGDFTSRAIKSDHLRAIARHGFTEEALGCPIWICDGDYGFDDVQVEIPRGVYMKHSFMGKKLLELDACIVVTHFKGHPMGVYGGALKNVGIGMGSKRGKISTHFMNHPVYGIQAMEANQAAAQQLAQAPHPNMVDRAIEGCPFDAFEWKDGVFHFHSEKCGKCAGCFSAALFAGLLTLKPEITATWAPTIADAASGYIHAIGKEKFLFVNYAMDISPWCDCVNFHDRPLVPNIGIFASKDPVAVDLACIEASEAKAALPESKADEFGFGDPGTERFTNVSSIAKISQWAQCNAGEYNGIGSTEYILVESEPGEETDFWFPPYTPDNIFGKVNKEALRSGNYEPGEYFYDLPRLSFAELHIKPKGKVDEISILDEE